MYQFKRFKGKIWLRTSQATVFRLLQNFYGFVSPYLIALELGQTVTIKEGYIRKV